MKAMTGALASLSEQDAKMMQEALNANGKGNIVRKEEFVQKVILHIKAHKSPTVKVLAEELGLKDTTVRAKIGTLKKEINAALAQ